jgi:SAM-dependent methyltransferase
MAKMARVKIGAFNGGRDRVTTSLTNWILMGRIRWITWKLQKSLRQRGALGTAHACVKRGFEALQGWSHNGHSVPEDGADFDRRFGVDTCGSIDVGQLHIDSDSWRFGIKYQAVTQAWFDRAMSRIDARFEEYHFIDMGSGKGRALLMAAALPFKEIVGVEFSPQLNEIAVRNIEKYRPNAIGCSNIRSVCVDATKYELPKGPAVCFFYNPFEAPVMEAVLANIECSLQRSGRPIWLAFVRRGLDSVAASSPSFRNVFSDDLISIFRSQGE